MTYVLVLWIGLAFITQIMFLSSEGVKNMLVDIENAAGQVGLSVWFILFFASLLILLPLWPFALYRITTGKYK